MVDVLKDDPIEGPPRKRLLTDPNPKKRFVTESPESTVSFDSSSDRLAKKTRELPNLSDCHSCAVRINYTNPRERLQPLDSMWRIVLLCKKCIKRVNSSHLCSYCFSVIVDEHECYKCRNCERSIHKDCVARFDSGLGLGFSVCVDCWIPDVVAKSLRARKKKFRKKNKECCEQTANLSESRVAFLQTNEPNSYVAEAKTVVSTNVTESAKCVSTVVASRKVVEDVESSVLFNRAMNSRTSQRTCSVSSCGRDDLPLACYTRRRAVEKTALMNASRCDAPLVCYSRNRRKGCFRDSVSLNPPLICYSRRRLSGKACSTSENSQENRFLFKYRRIGKGAPRPSFFGNNSDCCSDIDSANLYTESMPNTTSCRNVNVCDGIFENHDNDSNRFFLTYKRSSRSKPEFSCKLEECSPMLPSNHLAEPTALSSSRLHSSPKDDCGFSGILTAVSL